MYSLSRGRVYIHRDCDEGTRINDDPLIGLCNPYRTCRRLPCSVCEVEDHLEKFSWEDTGECLTDYRQRLKKQSPVFWRLWGNLISPFIGVSLGAVAAGMLTQNPIGLLVGGIMGGLTMWLFAGPSIAGLACWKNYQIP